MFRAFVSLSLMERAFVVVLVSRGETLLEHLLYLILPYCVDPVLVYKYVCDCVYIAHLTWR